MLAILPFQLLRAESKNCHVVERFFQKRGEKEMDWLTVSSCPSVSFDCPQRERERAGVHKWQRKEEKTKESDSFLDLCPILLLADSDSDIRHQSIEREWHSFGSFSWQIQSARGLALCFVSDCDGNGSWKAGKTDQTWSMITNWVINISFLILP